MRVKRCLQNSVSYVDGKEALYLPNLVDEGDDQGCKLVDDENNGPEKHRDALTKAVALFERSKPVGHDGGDANSIAILAALDVKIGIHVGCQRIIREVVFYDLEVVCEAEGRSLGSHGS